MSMMMRPPSFFDVPAQIERQVQDIFEDFAQGVGLNLAPQGRLGSSRWVPGAQRTGEGMLQRPWLPAVEVTETDQEVCVRAEVPGIRPEDIEIEITDHALILSGEHQETRHQQQPRNIQRSEFRYGQFFRRIPLPASVQSDQAQAQFQNGILEVALPKAQTEARKRIKVQAAQPDASSPPTSG